MDLGGGVNGSVYEHSKAEGDMVPSENWNAATVSGEQGVRETVAEKEAD